MERELPNEIINYKENFLLGLPIRQLVSAGCAIILSVIAFLLLKDNNYVLTIIVCTLVSLPPALLGFVNFNGINFEKLILLLIHKFFISSKTKIFISENFDWEMILKTNEKEINLNEKNKKDKKTS